VFTLHTLVSTCATKYEPTIRFPYSSSLSQPTAAYFTLSRTHTNMSRLWRVVVTASFDDNALCVEGSYHSTNVTVASPAPITLIISPEHHGGPDIQEYTFDTLGDGLQDGDKQPKSGVIRTCDNDDGCGPRSHPSQICHASRQTQGISRLTSV
jgi:hypothetical protein